MAVRKYFRRPDGAGATSLTTTGPKRGRGSVRIVAGRWRRSLVEVPLAEGLRPTSERVRETVYDWLAHLFGSLGGRSVLDMFAGSGAMGLEAASRGASAVDWVDTNRASIAAIRAALKRLGAGPEMRCHACDAFAFLESTPQRYDFIVIDPPFSKELQKKAAAAAIPHLADEGLLYVESPGSLLSEETLGELGLTRVRSAGAGAVRFELLARAGSALAGLAKPSKEEKRKKS